MDLPTGDRLWCSEKLNAERIVRMRGVVDDLIAKNRNQDAVMGSGLDAGWHHFFGWPAANRNDWVMVGFIRPYDEPVIADSLRRMAAVIVTYDNNRSITSDPRTWVSGPTAFSDGLCQVFSERLGSPIRIDAGCSVFPVKLADTPKP